MRIGFNLGRFFLYLSLAVAGGCVLGEFTSANVLVFVLWVTAGWVLSGVWSDE